MREFIFNWWEKIMGPVARSKNFPTQIVLFLIVCFSWWLMAATFGYQDQKMVLASKVWSDFGAHLPLVRSFSMGQNFPPEYPQFPNEPIRYHYLFYAVVGGLEAVGLRLDLAMNLVSAAGMTLLLWMVFVYAKQFANSVHAGLIAIVLVLLNSSLSWWQFTQKFLQASQSHSVFSWLVALVKQHNFAAFGPWDGGIISAFWTLNIFTNQRHLALSFGLILWLVWPLVKVSLLNLPLSKFSRWHLTLMLVVMAIFPLIHQAGWLILIGMIVGLLVSDEQKWRQHWPLIKYYVIGLVMAGLIFVGLVPLNKSSISWQLWFLVQDKTAWGIWNYWWHNIGAYLPLLIVFVFLPQKSRWLAWLAGGLLVATNLWQLSPDMINNHKLVNFALILMAIVTSGWLVDCWRQLGWLETLHIGWVMWLARVCQFSLVGLFLLLILGGITDFYPIVNDHPLIMPDWQKVPVASWLKNNTPPNSIILPTEFFYHPANLVGRKIFVDYGYFAWSLGYEDKERRKLLPQLFGQFPTTQQWCGTIRAQQIDYVIFSPTAKTIDDKIVVADSYIATHLQPVVVTEDEYKIYDVKELCRQ